VFKGAVVCLALLAMASAEVEHEAAANNKGDIDYRVSFRTDAPDSRSHMSKEMLDRCHDNASKGKFTIEILGEDGSTTGPQPLVDHPGHTKKDDGSYMPGVGMIQTARIHAKDVGRVQKIKIEGDSKDAWQPGWIKVNSNDYHSGRGNGIYYGPIHEQVSLGEPLRMGIKSYAPEEEGADGHEPANQHPDEIPLYKCEAAFCRKSEHRFATEGDDVPPTHSHMDENGYHYGPLGEGLPGTDWDRSMLGSHFMREFIDMESMNDDDEDEEDFLAAHQW